MPRHSGGDWFVCPVCGEEVPAKALACPGCGSDDRTGWSAETEYDGLDLPEPEGDASPDVWRDPPGEGAGARVPAWVIVTVVLLAILFAVMMVLGIL